MFNPIDLALMPTPKVVCLNDFGITLMPLVMESIYSGSVVVSEFSNDENFWAAVNTKNPLDLVMKTDAFEVHTVGGVTVVWMNNGSVGEVAFSITILDSGGVLITANVVIMRGGGVIVKANHAVLSTEE